VEVENTSPNLRVRDVHRREGWPGDHRLHRWDDGAALYDARCLADLHAMLKEHGDWMELGSKDEKQEPEEGTVEFWARSSDNPIGGWYGLKKNFRGRFGMYIPPLMEELGLAEVEHHPRNNRMRAI